MNIKRLEDTDIFEKTVLYSAPYDVGVKKENGKLVVVDDSRIKVTLPTLKYLQKNNCKIVILTWVKRPGGKVVDELSTKPHAEKLSSLLSYPVEHIDDCIGPKVENTVLSMKPSDIIMLENVRFYPQEKENDPVFARELIKNMDVIVVDSFPQAHRDEASTTGILRQGIPFCAGFYFQSELNGLSRVMENPAHPLTLVIGGVKAEDKVLVIDKFLDVASTILVGGKLPIMPQINPYKNNPKVKVARLDKTGFDISKESISEFVKVIEKSKMIIWIGPMGLFEDKKHAEGTRKIAKAIARTNGYKLGGGGDTAEAIKMFGLTDKFNFVSLAGGATLKFLAKETLPVLELLKEK